MSGASFTVRLETDSSTPVRKQFTSTFNKVGDEVWNKWDEFLQQEEERGKSNKSLSISPLLILVNRGSCTYPACCRQKCAMATSA
jgi:hypothetical protein